MSLMRERLLQVTIERDRLLEQEIDRCHALALAWDAEKEHFKDQA